MKKTLLFLFALALSCVVVAQNFSLENDTTFINIDLNAEEEFTVDIFNETGEALNLEWEIEVYDVPNAWTVRICDNMSCFEETIPSGSTMAPIGVSGNGWMKLKPQPGDVAYYATIEFKIFEIGDEANSQQMVFYVNAGNVSVEESDLVEPTVVFPNPMIDYTQLDFGTNGVDAIQVVDITGKVVLNESIINAQQRLDTSNWNQGLYFLQTYKLGKMQESIRLMKK